MEEIIIPNDFRVGHYTDRGTNSDLLNESTTKLPDCLIDEEVGLLFKLSLFELES